MISTTWAEGHCRYPQVPFRRVFGKVDRPVPDDAEIVTAYTDGVVTFRKNRRTSGYHEAKDLSGFRGVQEGDFVVHGLDILRGSVGVSDSSGAITSVCTVCTPTVDMDPRFFAYAMRSQAETGLPRALAKGIRSGGADFRRWETLADLPLPLPSVREQHLVADYLEGETKRIDVLLSARAATATLLAERRRVVISRTVLSGLDQSAPRTASGNVVAGTIPSHWRFGRLRNAVSAVIDTEHKTVHFVDGGNYPVIRTSDVKLGRLLIDQAKRTDVGGYEEWTRRGRPGVGDVFLSREAPAGEAAAVPKEPAVCMGQRMVLVKPKARILNPQFLAYWIYSEPVSVFIDDVSQGSTVRHLNMGDIPNIPLALPPIEEQRQIAIYLERSTSLVDDAIRTIEDQINLLSEYRQALITAAVTGQIDEATLKRGTPVDDVLEMDIPA